MRRTLWGIGLLLGTSVGCLVELDQVLACGDGYVNRQVGEECDPNDDASYRAACDGTAIAGVPQCDPISCTLQCVGCGDRELQAGEECDNGPFPGGKSRAIEPRECAGFDPLTAWDLPYASGTAEHCAADCFYDRAACRYCGNGQVDDATRLAPVGSTQSATSRAEKCDGDMFSVEFAASLCPAGTVPNATCLDDCQSIAARPGPECCVPEGAPCPDGVTAQCCHAFIAPDEFAHCENKLADPSIPAPDTGTSTCR